MKELKSEIESYLNTTSIHGFSYLGQGNGIFSKILWLSLTLTSFFMASIVIWSSFVDWNENQTITTVESIATPIQEKCTTEIWSNP